MSVGIAGWLIACLLVVPWLDAKAAEAPAGRPGYEAARWDARHFQSAIAATTDEQCLACHAEVLERRVRPTAPAGLAATEVRAWYQTLDTYDGAQDTFHRRHLVTPLATELMNLNCRFCHQGHDPREEAPGASASAPAAGGKAGFTLRKVVDTEATCLRCHGRFPFELMEGLEGPWHKVRADLEDEETPNACLTCHEELFRSVRHKVSYLKPAAIEAAAKKSSDVCFGCHGGRAWYRTSFPYARHPWPDMPEETPDWAKGRPTESEARFLIGVEK